MTIKPRQATTQRALGLDLAFIPRPTKPADPDGEARVPLTAEQRREFEQQRADAQPMSVSCAFCDWTLDATVGECREQARLHREQHHPTATGRNGKRGLGKWRRSDNDEKQREEAMRVVEQRRAIAGGEVEGLDLLERMDAGEPLGLDDGPELDDPELGELEPNDGEAGDPPAPPPAPADGATSPGRGGSPSSPAGSPPEPGSSSPSTPDDFAARRRRRRPYTREEVEQALRRFHTEHGRPPSQTDIAKHAYLPSAGGARAAFEVERWADVIEAMGWPRPTRATNYARSSRKTVIGVPPAAVSEREPQEARERPASAGPTSTQPPESAASSRSETAARPRDTNLDDPADRGRAAAWTDDEILDAIRRWADRYGQPPTSNEWTPRVDGYPSTATVAKHFGSWAAGIEAAGFPRPLQAPPTRQPEPEPPRWIKVPTTGLAYRSPEEAYVAAEEIEADGERVAEAARFDGHHAKADEALDRARDLAEKIRVAARQYEERDAGGSRVAEQPSLAPEPPREVTPETTDGTDDAASPPPQSGGASQELEPDEPVADNVALVPLDDLHERSDAWIAALQAEAVRLEHEAARHVRRAQAFRKIADGLTELEETAA